MATKKSASPGDPTEEARPKKTAAKKATGVAGDASAPAKKSAAPKKAADTVADPGTARNPSETTGHPSVAMNTVTTGSQTETAAGTESMQTAHGAVRHDDVRRRAYELYEARGGQHGHHERDWFEAENELRKKGA